MTTKAEERKALEQIRKIVEKLGDNSYLAMAFDGCFEMAEENIENDFGLSPRDKWEHLESELEEAKRNAAQEKRNAKAWEEVADGYEKKISEWQERYERATDSMKSLHDSTIENWNKFREQEDKNAELERQVMELKAKLYDYMVKEAH